MGYLVASSRSMEKISTLRRLVDIKALATLFRNGDMTRHLKKSVKLYGKRRDYFYDLLRSELGNVIHLSKPSGGMAFWVKFKKNRSLINISAQASELGLYLSNGTFYNTGEENYNGLRVGFASLNEKEIREAVSIIKRVVMAN